MTGTGRDGVELLRELGERQLELHPDPYLRSHLKSGAALRREVDAFELYRPHLPEGRILDWGCRHAPSACLIRNSLGNRVELHGCDRVDPAFEPFHEFAGIEYRKLDHQSDLPYPDGYFDAVVANGVLEHVADPDSSLHELSRILALDGVLVITFLPNRRSVSEALSRRTGRVHHHRLYGYDEARTMLAEAGFEVRESGYHQVMPSASNAGHAGSGMRRRLTDAIYRADPLLRRTPLRRLAANLYLIAIRK